MSWDYRNKLSNGARWVWSAAKQRHLGFADAIIAFVGGWVIGMKVSPNAGAVLVTIACVLFVWRVAGWVRIDEWMGRGMRLSLVIVASILLPLLAWNSIVGFVRPAELPNKYVRLYENPTYGRNSRSHPYALLIEFGVRRSQIRIDIELQTADNYSECTYYFGTPLTDDASENPTTSVITIGSCHTEVDESTPVYSIKAENTCLIYADKSLYIYFESDHPLSVRNVMFTGEEIHL